MTRCALVLACLTGASCMGFSAPPIPLHDADEGLQDVQEGIDVETGPEGEWETVDGIDGFDAADPGETEDAGPEADMPPACIEGSFVCDADGTASLCLGGAWSLAGLCPYGCDEASRSCTHPGNIPAGSAAHVLDGALGAPPLADAASPVVFDSDDGSIVDGEGTTLRRPGEGMVDGVFFETVAQDGGSGERAGLFVMSGLTVPAGMTLLGAGSLPLVLLVRDDVHIYGTIDVGASHAGVAASYEGHHVPGPGGWEGGAGDTDGDGPGGGGGGGGGVDCLEYVSAGGGGGGFGGSGGRGGDGGYPPTCPTFDGGAAGASSGSADLAPLVGGSGGGGGSAVPSVPSLPGHGGAGGGAIQISSLGTVHVYATAVVTAPGGGGGGGSNEGGGGGGGGSGGAVLLEGASVLLDGGGVIAANGGGGGSGDCA